MTDLPSSDRAVPARLGMSAHLEDGRLVLSMPSHPGARHLGVVRASVVAFLVDAVTGISIDDDPDAWALTSDLSLHMLPVPAPEVLIAGPARVLRRGKRSVTCQTDVRDPDGRLVAIGSAGFAKVPCKPTDPPKPHVTPEVAARMFGDQPPLDRPIREAAGVEVLDAAAGVHQLLVRPEVQNPNGTLQGAMVALLAEAAAEDLLAARSGGPVLVTDLELRYLARAEVGPVRTSCRVVGDTVEVTLTDTSTDTVTTLVYVRAVSGSIP